MEEELKPSSADEVMQDYMHDTKVVKVGKSNYKIKKFDPLNQCVLNALSLPEFSNKEGVTPEELKAKAASIMNSKENRGTLMKQALLTCVLEPPINEGEARKRDGKYVSISYEAMDPTDRIYLMGEIFKFSGFSKDSEKFFRDAAGEGVALPGPDRKPLQDAATSAAGAAG